MREDRRPYTLDAKGRIRWRPGGKETFRPICRCIGVDVDDLHTEAAFDAAFERAGDHLFRQVIAAACQGERVALDFLDAFRDGRFSDARAIIGRATFRLVRGDKTDAS
ncbi:MAG: hypothetical protein B7Z66_12145 [Chromatiales bacterium 21-64-14]|nr:MAG: hypothetical protein B7Z66_12145 [Chromatiales bacterium 21-64-14]